MFVDLNIGWVFTTDLVYQPGESFLLRLVQANAVMRLDEGNFPRKQIQDTNMSRM